MGSSTSTSAGTSTTNTILLRVKHHLLLLLVLRRRRLLALKVMGNRLGGRGGIRVEAGLLVLCIIDTLAKAVSGSIHNSS